MTSDFPAIIADARTMWRGNRDLLLRVAGVFFFLPALALRLFVQPDMVEDVTLEQAFDATMEWAASNAHWLLAAQAVELYGSALVLLLLLDRGHPTLGEAMARTSRLLPSFLLLWLLTSLLSTIGTIAFILPGIYLIGRTFVVGAALMAEPEKGPGAAFATGIRATRGGRAWLLFLGVALWWLASAMGSALAVDVALLLDSLGAGPIGAAAGEMLSALVSAAMTLVIVLAQAAAYRRFAESKQGI
ncbi:hypothetical protein [Stakelama tenebrarum]|uniref:Glycerophosphoryl diester phosphodiesterase membrane domain-containing protein n=1 Tax=Stakelama tenebrarum TaxID=2711215 RepID=A0A6G6Y2Q1_9SPHN|nr:hypothetical protein [Sphingosinithalassobacter tenebrarum]QIG79121.1 hypothetical protein G5C33_04515 [Sphingosinithalassobacter tenebrarum]